MDGLDVKVDDEHHMLFDCEAFAHLRMEPFVPCEEWNGEAWCDRTIRDFVSTAEFYGVYLL